MHAETLPDHTPSPRQDPRYECVRALLGHLEAGNEAEAGRCLDELTRLRETELFRELGRLTRELHNALTSFRLDERFATLAQVEIPDAKDRLHYVVQLTEQAASRTLGVVEQARPLCEELGQRAEALARDWQRFLRRDMSLEDFRVLAAQLGQFLPQVSETTGKLYASLGEVLMAQTFQDLTGQIIKRVITLVEELEGNLVKLIRLSGQKLSGAAAEVGQASGRLDGPQIPGRVSPDAVSGQDEVDALLSSLGF